MLRDDFVNKDGYPVGIIEARENRLKRQARERATDIYDMMDPGHVLIIHAKSEDRIIVALKEKGLVLMEIQAKIKEVTNA